MNLGDTMFNKIKSILKKDKDKEKHIIVCIHGFGVRTIHHYDNFKLWSNGKYNFHTFEIFVKENEEDCNPHAWISRCENAVHTFLQLGYKVDVVGFSMGGVLASHVASKYNIGRLFLIAPSFEYLNANNVVSKTRDMFVKKEDSKEPVLPSSFTSCFMEVVRLCKEDIKNVKCPVCIVHGNQDEVIPYRSSINIFNHIPHDRKQLFIINKGVHRMMSQEHCGYEVYKLFELFMDHQILPDIKPEFSKDVIN